MSRVTAAYRAQLQVLRALYARELPRKARRVVQAASAAARASHPRYLKSLHRLVHRLAGSAAIFGFPGVSQAASALEDFVASALREGGPPPAIRRLRLRALAAALEVSCELPRGDNAVSPPRGLTRAARERTRATSRTRSTPRAPSGP